MKDKTKILVVDDDDSMLFVLKDALEREEYYVITCSDGSEAVKILSQVSFQIVITDLRMPNMDGNKLITEIKKINQAIEVIMISSERDFDTAVDVMKKGAYDFISKPVDLKKLMSSIKRCEEKIYLISENLELKERITFFELSQGLATILNMQELLDMIMESIQKVILIDQGSIMLLDKRTNSLFVKVSVGLDKVLPEIDYKEFREGPSWEVLKDENAVVIQNGIQTTPFSKEIKSNEKINSSMIVPLKIRNKIIGVVNLSRTKMKTAFGERDLSLLKIFAGHAAIAIENAYLYDKLKSYSKIIKQEKEEIETILKNISDGIVVSDRSNKIILHNNSFTKIFRLDKDSLNDKSLEKVFEKDKYSEMLSFIKKFDHSKENYMEMKFNMTIDGENVHLRVTIVNIEKQKNKEKLKIVAFQDLTRLVHSQKMAAWQNMARSLAHEVKNPLSPILWAAEGILEKNESSGALDEIYVEKKCNTIIKEVKRLKDLISEFSSFAKHHDPDLKSGSIGTVLEEVLSLYSNLSNIRIKKDLPSEFPVINMNENMMKQVFINIIQNAIDAMPDGGELYVKGTVLPDNISLSFKDTGTGIPDKIKEHLFNPYFTTKKNGTGLGLTILSKILTDHNGKIRIISNENEGTNFIVNLPVI